jgi:hypothetical protein
VSGIPPQDAAEIIQSIANGDLHSSQLDAALSEKTVTIWLTKTVYYSIDFSEFCGGLVGVLWVGVSILFIFSDEFTSSERLALYGAIKVISENTCIKFRRVVHNKNTDKTDKDKNDLNAYVNIIKRSVCASHLGMQVFITYIFLS